MPVRCHRQDKICLSIEQDLVVWHDERHQEFRSAYYAKRPTLRGEVSYASDQSARDFFPQSLEGEDSIVVRMSLSRYVLRSHVMARESPKSRMCLIMVFLSRSISSSARSYDHKKGCKNAGIASDADSRKKNDVRNKKGNSGESEMNSDDDDDDEEEGGSELESIIESEKRKTDDAYRAGESESRDLGS